MSTKDRVNVFLRHRFHVLRKPDLLTSQEISRVFGMGPNATPINQALLKLFNAGLVTRLMRKPSNTYEWRTSTITVAPTDAELQCLPPELVVQLEREEAALKKVPAAQQIPIPEAADLHRAGLPTVVVPAPSFGPPTEPTVFQATENSAYDAMRREFERQRTPDAADLSAPPVVIEADLARETQAAEYRADVTAAALFIDVLQESGETPDVQPITLSDVLERYRARQYDRLQIDDAAIIDLARVILQRESSPSVFVSIPTATGINAAFSVFPLVATAGHIQPAPTEGFVDTIPKIAAETRHNAMLESAMDSALSQLAQPKCIRLSVPDQVLWALAKLGPALPPPIGALLAEAHAILSKPLLTAA